MDGGIAEIHSPRERIIIDVDGGPPRAWIAFLIGLAVLATTLVLIVAHLLREAG